MESNDAAALKAAGAAMTQEEKKKQRELANKLKAEKKAKAAAKKKEISEPFIDEKPQKPQLTNPEEAKKAGATMTPEEKKAQREAANKLKAEKKAQAAAKKLAIMTDLNSEPRPKEPTPQAEALAKNKSAVTNPSSKIDGKKLPNLSALSDTITLPTSNPAIRKQSLLDQASVYTTHSNILD